MELTLSVRKQDENTQEIRNQLLVLTESEKKKAIEFDNAKSELARTKADISDLKQQLSEKQELIKNLSEK